ncbi:MAG: bacillithiol biosynthesis BshC [Fibrobacteres bacterium]|nr:bacillithiol biosynthesis BshC [Fibrobacterota bacterium]
MKPIFEHRSIFGGLAADYIEGGLSSSLFEYRPTLKSIMTRVERIGSFEFDRATITDSLIKQNTEWGASGKTIEKIREINKKNTVIVSAGHQSCLCGGPLYVAYKILTAVNTAALIEKSSGKKALPLFWLAADDDDLDEVSSIEYPDGQMLKIDITGKRGPASFLSTPEDMLRVIPQLKAKDWGDYHAKLLVKLFSPFGVAFIHPFHKTTIELRKPFFKAFKSRISEVADSFGTATSALTELGFKPQVKLKSDDAHCYKLSDNRRERLKRTDLPESNEIILTSALTRLLSLEYTLPIAAEISGPSEIAYHAQTKKAYQVLDREMPVIIPRSSITIAYSDQLETIEKASIPYESILAPKTRLQIPQSDNEATIDTDFENFENRINEAFENLREPYLELAPGLTTAFEASRRKAASVSVYLKKKLSSSVRKSALNNNSELLNALHFIFPDAYQERTFAFLPFTEKDPGFLENISEFCLPFNSDHHIIDVGEP